MADIAFGVDTRVVWLAETENIVYGHPAVHEACVIAVLDERRGETVKLLLMLNPGSDAEVTAEDIAA